MSSWFRSVRSGSFRSSLRIKPLQHSWPATDDCSVISNMNAAVRHSPPASTASMISSTHADSEQPGADDCPEHPGHPAPYYCTQCQTFACHVCLEHGTHYGHGLRLLREAAEAQQRQLGERLEALAQRLEALQVRHTQMEAFELSYAETQRAVRETANVLVDQIRTHEERLLHEAADVHRALYRQCGVGRREELQQNALTLDILRRRAQSVVDDRALARDNPAHFLLCHRKLADKLTAFENLFPQQDVRVPLMDLRLVRCNTAFGIIETLDQDRTQPASPAHIRSISLPSSPQPQMNNKKRVGSSPFVQPSKVRLALTHSLSIKSPPLNASEFSQMIHTNGPCSPVHSFSLPPTPPLKDCDYMLPLKSGSIKARSEQPSQTAKCVWKITKEGSEPGEINCPSDVAFLFDGSVVVADRDNGRLQIFDSQGNFVKTFGSERFKPRRLAIMKNGNIAVTDAAENCVKVFELNGSCVAMWGRKWYKSVFKSPCGIAVNRAQNLVVSDMERHSVSIFSPEGKLVKHLQCEANHDFHSPAYLATDSRDRVIVADNWQQCVKVFDDASRIHFQFHRTGTSDDSCLEYPNGVCTDADDCIYVADWGTHSVSKFDRDGHFLEHILTREDGLYHPAGVATMDKYIAVTAYCDSQSSVALYAM